MRFLSDRSEARVQMRTVDGSKGRRVGDDGLFRGIIRNGAAAALALAVGAPGVPGGGMPMHGNGFAPLFKPPMPVQIIFSRGVAGYFAFSGTGKPMPYFTGVEGSWVAGGGVDMKGKGYVAYTQAVSIGIRDSIYAGTSTLSANGTVQHFAIVWGTRHAPERITGFAIKSGDIIQTAIEKDGRGRYAITIKDITEGEDHTATIERTGEARIVGWILQRSSDRKPKAARGGMQYRTSFMTATANKGRVNIGSGDISLVGSMMTYQANNGKDFPTLAATISYVKRNASGFSISYTGN